VTEKRVSVAGVRRDQLREGRKLQESILKKAQANIGDVKGLSAVTADSFVNFAQLMGIGAENPLGSASYGFNPVTRIRTVLEWCHRGSWLGGVAIDLVADDMTRKGIEHTGKLDPEQIAKMNAANTRLGIWKSMNSARKWARLYGGSLAVMGIDGQDFSTPLRVEAVGKGDFKGLIVLDRWMVEPDLTNLIQDLGPDLGLPKFYYVRGDGPGLRGKKIHYSRVLRMIGIELPYWQAVQENLWGESVLERLWDRMTAFDSATTGMAQLVYKAYLRTYKIKSLRTIVASGGAPLKGLMAQVNLMRRTQSIEGITLLDGEDEMEAMQGVPFSGLADVVMQIGQQLAGSLQVPLVRLFGQSPTGLNSSGESDLRTYYDNIAKEQNRDTEPVTTIQKVMARSEGIALPDDYGIKWRPLWELTEKEKAEVGKITTEAVVAAVGGNILSQQTALKELKQSSQVSGIFSNVTQEEIDMAEETLPPAGEEAILGEHERGLETIEATAQARQPAGPRGSTTDSIQAVGDLYRDHGLHVVIETRKGEVRRSKEGNGPMWEAALAADYGYCRRTTGADGDAVDCFVGPNPASSRVFVIWQRHIDGLRAGAFDEHKVMLGYETLEGALADYAGSYSDGRALERVMNVQAMTMEAFKAWLAQHPDQRWALAA
jgi:phage-related protein (TIGR01555 family)